MPTLNDPHARDLPLSPDRYARSTEGIPMKGMQQLSEKLRNDEIITEDDFIQAGYCSYCFCIHPPGACPRG